MFGLTNGSKVAFLVKSFLGFFHYRQIKLVKWLILENGPEMYGYETFLCVGVYLIGRKVNGTPLGTL